MDYVQLAGIQAKNIEELKAEVKDLTERCLTIQMVLYRCGSGPLNDNNLNYTK